MGEITEAERATILKYAGKRVGFFSYEECAANTRIDIEKIYTVLKENYYASKLDEMKPPQNYAFEGADGMTGYQLDQLGKHPKMKRDLTWRL